MAIRSDLFIQTATTAAMALGLGIGFAEWGAQNHETVIAALAGAIAGGVVGNLADRLMCHGAGAIEVLLSDGDSHGLPPNHDVVRALRSAQLNAVWSMARCTIRAERLSNPTHDRSGWAHCYRIEDFERRIRRWLKMQRRRNAKSSAAILAPRSAAIMAEFLPEVLDKEKAPCRGIGTHDMWRATSAAIMVELLAASVSPLEAFRAAMAGERLDGIPSWKTSTRRFFWEEIKAEAAIYRVVSLQMLRDQADARMPRD